MQSDARRTYQLRSCGFDHHLAPIPPCDVAGPVEGPFKALDYGIEGVLNFPMDGLDRIFIVLLTLMAPHS
jgi:hypothetical protein